MLLRPNRTGPIHAWLAAALAALAPACCVNPPSPTELFDAGFRSPEQAFRAFQVAVRADDAELELRCFSSGMRARERLSQLTWREAREEFYGRNPFLRSFVVGAQIERAQIDGAAARLEVSAGSHRFGVELVREDYAAAWSGEERVLDRDLAWNQATLVQTADGVHWILGRVELPAGVEPESVSELRFGREWKIDRVGELDAAPAVP